jgi:hypothetical protein
MNAGRTCGLFRNNFFGISRNVQVRQNIKHFLLFVGDQNVRWTGSSEEAIIRNYKY